MKLQIISTVPSTVATSDVPGAMARILRNHFNFIVPDSWQMPGTRVYAGLRAVHFALDTLDDTKPADVKWFFETVQAAGVLDWEIIAGQKFRLTPIYDDSEPPVQTGWDGLFIPVPQAFVHMLQDIPIYDEDGIQIGTERPVVGHPLHTYDGADPWVWAE